MTGLRLELHGGTYLKQSQMAIIDLQCDPERTGNEKSPVKKGKDDADERPRNAGSDENDDPKEGDDDEDNNSLHFVSYKKEGDQQILRLDWRTKYACESYEEDDDEGSGKDGTSKHWGFFTWFIIMYVLSTLPTRAVDADISTFTASSSASPPTSSSDPGSTTTVTVREVGIFFPTATQSETSHTYSKTGREKWLVLFLVGEVEGGIVLYRTSVY